MFALLVAIVLLLIVILSGRAQEAVLTEDSLATPTLAGAKMLPTKVAPDSHPGGLWRSSVPKTASVQR